MNADYASELWQRLSDRVNRHQGASLSDLTAIDKKIARQRWFAENLLVFLLQYMGLAMTTLSLPPYPVWLASGTACGFIFLRGTRILPGLFLGCIVAYLGARAPLPLALPASALFALQATLLLKINYRFGNVSLVFYRLPALLLFLLSTALVTFFTTVTLAKLCHSTAWLPWWLANFNGVVILGCGLLTWDAYFTQIQELKPAASGWLGGVFALLALLCVSVLCNHWVTMAMICIVLLTLYIARRFGWCGVIAALLMIAGLTANSLSPLFLTTLTTISLISCR